MFYGSETWCLGQNEIGILLRTERALVKKYVCSQMNEYEFDKRSNPDVGLEQWISW